MIMMIISLLRFGFNRQEKKRFKVSKITAHVNNGVPSTTLLIPISYKKIAICLKGC